MTGASPFLSEVVFRAGPVPVTRPVPKWIEAGLIAQAARTSGFSLPISRLSTVLATAPISVRP